MSCGTKAGELRPKGRELVASIQPVVAKVDSRELGEDKARFPRMSLLGSSVKRAGRLREQKVPYERSGAATAKIHAKRKGTTPVDIVVLVLCTLPFIVFAAGIAVLLGQPSLSVTLVLWGSMVVLIVIFFGAFAWKLRNRSRQSQ